MLDVSIVENAASGKVSDVIFEKVTNSNIDTIELISSEKIIDGKNGMSLTLQETKDIVETIPMYHIKHLYEPIYDGVTIDWKNDLKWRGYYVTIDHWIASNEYDEYFGLALKSTGHNEPNATTDFGQIQGSGGAASGSAKCGWLYMQFQNWTDYELKKSIFLTLNENMDYQDTYMTKYEFEHIPWLFCPGTPNTYNHHIDYDEITLEMFEDGTLSLGGYGDGGACYQNPHIMIDNVDAELLDIESQDTTAKETKLVGYLKFRYICDGLEKSDGGIKIPVYRELYICRNGVNN